MLNALNSREKRLECETALLHNCLKIPPDGGIGK